MIFSPDGVGSGSQTRTKTTDMRTKNRSKCDLRQNKIGATTHNYSDTDQTKKRAEHYGPQTTQRSTNNAATEHH